MSRITIDLPVERVVPDRALVLAQQGVPAAIEVPSHIEEIHAAAIERFLETAEPRGVLSGISAADFAHVYQGEGRNDDEGPVADIFPRADHLALFAVTVGAAVTESITEGFASKDFAVASMLDAVASEAADKAAEIMESRFEKDLRASGWSPPDGGVLRYSPGYCGWHVTGQRRLFAELRPEEIGITLTESCLMQPLKSVSGVLIGGPEVAHRFPPTYAFCPSCATFACRERLRALRMRVPAKWRGTA